MKREQTRVRRVAEAIQRELADLIQRELRDPRLGPVTITAVEVSNDLSHARVFCTSWRGEESSREAVAGLSRASGFLRQRLARRLTTYRVPELHFLYDEQLERAFWVSHLLTQMEEKRAREESAEREREGGEERRGEEKRTPNRPDEGEQQR
ncbi:MAG: 30S ribosome-binding factor RbfA [Hydrogenophilus sp.]|nr:30S ribosome-binding factor RbfA [Hydrogenophilus sp.]